MGKWMEVLSRRPGDTVGYAGRRPLILAEMAPHPLLQAGLCLGREHRGLFPMLDLIRMDSPAYVDEWLWLDEVHMAELLAELRRVRRIGRREEFLPGLDGRRYYDLWRRDDDPRAFEAWLDQIEVVLGLEGGRWALLTL